MKIKIVIVILVVFCIALAIALFANKKQTEERHVADVSSIVDFSNQVVNAQLQISDLNQVNLALTNDIAASQEQLAQLSNNLAAAAVTLANSKTALSGAQDQIASLNSHISDLEAQNKELDQRASDLTNTVDQLNQSIEAIRLKLATSDSNNKYLQQELQKQMAQKAEIEHKFNDLDQLRDQVKKIKSELFVARRVQLMKNDISQKKGAELLMSRAITAPNKSDAGGNYGLNVEIGSDGSVNVIPALGAATNSAAH
jgi:chromosome segregation ATPase